MLIFPKENLICLNFFDKNLLIPIVIPTYSDKEQSLVDGMDPGIAGDTGELLKWCDRNQMAYQAVGMYSAYFDRAFRVYLRSQQGR